MTPRGVALAALVVLSSSAQAQASQAPTFPTGTSAITCDVVVRDKDGRPVRDLTRADFTLLDDGKPQAIAAFEARELALPAPLPPALGAELVATNEDRAIRGRTLAILLDDLGTSASAMQEVNAGVGRWLRERAHPHDDVTLATSSGRVWWSDRVDRGRDDLVAVLSRVTGLRSPQPLSDWEAYRNAVFEDATGASAASRGEGSGSSGPPNLLGNITQQTRMLAEEVRRDLRRRTLAVLKATERLSRGLAGTRGRKAILVFSEGFLNDPEQSRLIDQAIDASQRANTVIYFLDAGRLAGRSLYSAALATPPDPSDAGAMSMETLLATSGTELLAEQTGGISIRTNDLAEGLARVAEESSVYYLLGYEPETPLDGKWHRLEVKVARSGVTVRTRRAYQAAPQPPLTAEPDRKRTQKPAALPHRALDPAVMTSGATEALPLRLAPYVLGTDEKGTARVLVVMELDASRLSIRREGKQRAVDLTVVGISRDSPTTFPLDERATIDITPGGEPGWLILSREIRLPPGVAQVRALVRDVATGLGGTASQRLEVPAVGLPYIATPVLTDRALTRNGALRLVPVAHRRFQLRRHLFLFCSFEVLGMTNANGEVSTRIAGGYFLRASDGRIVRHAPATRIAVALGGKIVRVMALPIEGLEPGEYELILDVVDEASGRTLTSREVFVLEPFPSQSQVSGSETAATSRDELRVVQIVQPPGPRRTARSYSGRTAARSSVSTVNRRKPL